MLNAQLPLPDTTKSKYPEQIKLQDGEEFVGEIQSGEVITTSFGETYKFTFIEQGNGKTKVFLNKNNWVVGKLNNTNKGDVIRLRRLGVGMKTRWLIDKVNV